MTRRSVLFLPALLPLAHLASAFQGNGKRVSPHETVSVDLSGKTISITYGRPYLKGRDASKVEPYGKVWRLGADEATKITVSAPTKIGPLLQLAPGSYSLFAITGPEKWTLIVNKVAEQWGAFSYEESQDLGRIDLPVEKTASPVEQFTITLTKQSADTAKLSLAWGNQSVSTTLRVG